MLGINVGEMIKSLRLYKGLDLNQLASDICTVEELEQFERGEKYPGIEQIYLLTERLNINFNTFFNISVTGVFDYKTAIYDLINKYKRQRNYEAIFTIVQREMENPVFQEPSRKQFLLWHEGICLFHLNGLREESLHILKQAIRLTNEQLISLTEQEIEIMISIAIIENLTGNPETAEKYFKDARENVNNLPYLVDPKVELRILFGLSQTLTEQSKFKESNLYSQQGISICINNELLYLFGEFHYQLGENFSKLEEIEIARKWFEKAISIFTIQDNEKFAKLVKIEMEKFIS